jgi:hypothetical protein
MAERSTPVGANACDRVYLYAASMIYEPAIERNIADASPSSSRFFCVRALFISQQNTL